MKQFKVFAAITKRGKLVEISTDKGNCMYRADFEYGSNWRKYVTIEKLVAVRKRKEK